MSVSSVPTIIFGPTGFIPPDESAILAGIQADDNAAFGGNMNPALETPQGQLATSKTAIVGAANDAFVKLANGVDPAFADGRMQDGIARIYFLTRNPAEPTTVTATCRGLAGVVIPVGALAIATDGNLYLCTEAGTIPIGGSIDLQFACQVAGPIACPATSLNAIYQSIPGWDSISNAGDGVLGNNVESRADFEVRRTDSVAKNSVGSLPSMRGAVLSVTGVLDAKVVENVTASPVTINGVTVAPKSIYVSVAGGAAAVIAQAIWTKKSPGCDYNGNTSFTVYDDGTPYVVSWETPAPLPIKFAVNLTNNTGIPSDALTQIQNAIIQAFNGVDGGARARIGSTIFASRFYGGILALGAWAQLITVLIGTATPTATSVLVNLDNVPTVVAADIAVNLI